MSTTVSLPSPRSTSRRTQILAAASALVAAGSVTVTLAVAGGGDTAKSQPVAAPATAKPNPTTQYRNDAALGQRADQGSGPSAADRFHHFR
jgi:hypothetical protein